MSSLNILFYVFVVVVESYCCYYLALSIMGDYFQQKLNLKILLHSKAFPSLTLSTEDSYTFEKILCLNFEFAKNGLK